MFFFEIYGF